MEFIDLFDIEEFHSASVIKKIPIITDQLIATLICIDKKKKTTTHNHTDFDEFHLIMKGRGRITIGKNCLKLNEGMLVFVPQTKSHYFSTEEDRLTVLTISRLPENEIVIDDGRMKR